MKFEDLQNSWKTQAGIPNVTVSADSLLREVQRNSKGFDRTVFWRDVREIGLAALGGSLFMYWSICSHVWPHFLVGLSYLWGAGYLLAATWRYRRMQPLANNPLHACIEMSLRKINAQISLLKSVARWGLLPFAVALSGELVFYWQFVIPAIGMAPESRRTGMWIVFVVIFAGLALSFAFSLWAVYRLNQFVVRKYLEPRRLELETLLNSITN